MRGTQTYRLQWGRDVIVAEIMTIAHALKTAAKLQWGRDVIVAEISRSRASGPLGGRLQWGRDVIVAEIELSYQRFVEWWEASMGPRRYRRGNSEKMIMDGKG